jgi:hypothetical protein
VHSAVESTLNPLINQLITTSLPPVGQQPNQSINKPITNLLLLLGHATGKLGSFDATENTIEKVPYYCYLFVIKNFRAKCGQKSDFGQKWQSVDGRPKRVDKICLFRIKKIP